MQNVTELDDLAGLEWLVAARSHIQSLLLLMHQRWDELPAGRRHLALGAMFSLWRAVFLLAEREIEEPIDPRTGGSLHSLKLRNEHFDPAAQEFLLKLIRHNAINFSDDLKFASWTASYYISDATLRIKELGSRRDFWSESSRMAMQPRIPSLRWTWNASFEALDEFIRTSKSERDGHNGPHRKPGRRKADRA